MDKETFLAIQRVALGERIKYIRIKRGYPTQKTFAQHFMEHERTTSIISRMESGVNLDFSTIVRLIRKLETTTFSLFDFKNQFPLDHVIHNGALEDTIQSELIAFGKRLKEIRKKKGLVQLDIEVMGLISDNRITQYERGEITPEFDTISSIAYGINIETHTLFDYKNLHR